MVFWCKLGGVDGGEVEDVEPELDVDLKEAWSMSDSDIWCVTKKSDLKNRCRCRPRKRRQCCRTLCAKTREDELSCSH